MRITDTAMGLKLQPPDAWDYLEKKCWITGIRQESSGEADDEIQGNLTRKKQVGGKLSSWKKKKTEENKVTKRTPQKNLEQTGSFKIKN